MKSRDDIARQLEEEADLLVGDEQEGLIEKYEVRRNADDTVVVDCFVLRYDRDPHALVAIAAYAESVRPENSKLSDDLRQLVKDWCRDG